MCMPMGSYCGHSHDTGSCGDGVVQDGHGNLEWLSGHVLNGTVLEYYISDG